MRALGTRSHLATVERFEHVPSAEIHQASLPTDPAPIERARTLQASRTPLLDGDVSRAPARTRATAVRIAGARLITGSGAVVTSDGLLVRESLVAPEIWDREFARSSRIRRSRRVAGEHASLVSSWSGNYYHWLIECLPRIATLEAVGFGDLPLVVCEPLARFQRESLALLGFGSNRLTPFAGELGNLAPEALVWAGMPSPVNYPTPFVVDWLQRRLGAPSTAPLRRSVAARRYLLSRRNASRRLANESELLRALRPMGFQLLVPEEMDFPEQVAAFGQACAIIAPHGAGLTNIVFSRPMPVLELFPPDRIAWHYYTLARAAGHEYWYAVGSRATAGYRQTRDDFVVDVDLVRRTAEAMIGGRRGSPGL